MARTIGTGTNYMNLAVFNTAIANVTIALWVKLISTGGGASRVLIGNGNNTGGGTGFGLGFQSAGSSTIQMLIQGLAWLGSGTALTTGTWTHLTMGKAAGNWFLYKDGVAIENVAGTPNTPAGNMWLGGANDGTTGCPDASLAEAGLWTVLLTDPEIVALAKGTSPNNIRRSSLVAYWPLWGAGAPEADLSSGVHNMAITGTVPAANHSPSGEYTFVEAPVLTNVVVPVTTALTATATNTTTLAAIKINARTLSVVATGVLTLKRDAIRKLTITIVSIPKKLTLITRVMTTLVGVAVPRVLRQPGRKLAVTILGLPVVRLIRFGASAWDEIDAHRKWGITDVGKWSIKQVQRFQFSSAMKGR